MKEKTLNKLQELAKKDYTIKSIISAYLFTNIDFDVLDIEKPSEREQNKIMIDILKEEKSNSIIQEAIRILENDTKEDNNNQKNNNKKININIKFNIKSRKIK